MVLGAPFQQKKPISVSELNQKTITYTPDPTAEVVNPGQVMYCTADSASYFQDDVVSKKYNGSGLTLISQNKHLHNADTNKAGGLLSNVLIANLSSMFFFHKLIGFGLSDLRSYTNSTGNPLTNDLPTGAVKWDTTNVANTYVVSKLTGGSPSLKVPLSFKSINQFHGNATNVFVREGINMEPMDVSNDNTAKFGIETCAASNGNWNIVSAEGGPLGQRTAIDGNANLEGTTVVDNKTGRRMHQVDYVPGSYINYTYQDNSIVSKSTNLPATNSIPNTIPPDNVFTIGVKTADTNAKQLYIWGLAIVGGVDDLAWK